MNNCEYISWFIRILGGYMDLELKVAKLESDVLKLAELLERLLTVVENMK